MKKLIILISSILLIGTLSFSQSIEEYVKVVNDMLAISCTSPDTIKGWEEGVKKEFNCELDHLRSTFVLSDVKQAGDKIILAGTITTTGYAYRDKQKVRIIQIVIVAYLINKDKIIEDSIILEAYPPKVIEGWVGLST